MSDSGVFRIRGIVNEDYTRISGESDPYIILNVEPDASWESVNSRFESYERFYRVENFQRIGDMDLTRKALDIRRAVARAIADIRSRISKTSNVAEGADVGRLVVDPKSAALGDICFRDGLTYLKLGDLDVAHKTFRTACDYDPSRGILLAYLSYTAFRRRMNEPDVVEESRRNLIRAIEMQPLNSDIERLVTRFFEKTGDRQTAIELINRVRHRTKDSEKIH